MYYCAPFSSWEEWRFVYHSFYPPPGLASVTPAQRIEQLSNALLVVKVWEGRGAKVPPAVSVTAQLVELKYNQDFMTSGLRAVRLASAMVVVRAVNVVVDELQDQLFAQSIQMLAGKAGLPRWLVDIRHEAAHGMLPSHEVLAKAVETLLEFFREHYWEKQQKFLVEGQRTEAYVNSVLERCAKGYFTSVAQLDDAVDKLATGTRTSTFQSLLVPKLVSVLTASLHPWERVLAGLNDKLGSFTSVLFDVLCDCLVDENSSSGLNTEVGIFWVQYLLSRRWHSLSDPSVSRMRSGRTLILVDENTWTTAESKWMLGPAAPALNAEYRMERWIRKALQYPHQTAKALLLCLNKAWCVHSVERQDQIETLISIYERKGANQESSLRPSLEEVERFLATSQRHSESLISGNGTSCDLSQAKNCNQWTLVKDFGQCAIGLVPSESPVPGVLEAFAKNLYQQDECLAKTSSLEDNAPDEEVELAPTVEKPITAQILDVKLLF